MATITSLPVASTIDAVADTFPIVTNSINTTQQISRNTFLSLSSAPVGLTDVQTLTSKTLTNPTINSATLTGTISGTYTLGGTPTFPSTVVTTTGTQTLTSKTLTSPTINSPTITNATISADTLTGYTTSNTGTVYGIPVTTGVINTAGTINGASLVAGSVGSAALATNSVTNSAITTGNLYTSKVYNPYKCRYYLGADQSVIAGFVNQRIIFNTLTYDTSSNYSTGTGFFTAPVAGFYCIQSNIRVLNGASANEVDLNIQVNGFTVATSIRTSETASGTYSYVLSDVQKLNATDTISISFSGGNAATIKASSAATYISIFLVSAT